MRCLCSILLVAGFAAAAGAQTPSERGAILIMRGTDTLVSDRFIRTGDTLKGIVAVRAQPSVEYIAALSSDDGVRTLSVAYYRVGAPASEPPDQHFRLVMLGDTVLAETQTQTLRIPTKVGAIPIFGNALALTELFTRRAAATGGSADIPSFSVLGLVTLPVTVRRVQDDTETVSTLQEVQRLKTDAAGRIVGGTIEGTRLRFVRAGPALASGLELRLRQ